MRDLKTIQDIKQKINSLSKGSLNKRAKDILEPEDATIIASALEVTNKYSTTDWFSLSQSEIQIDLIRLQSILISLASRHGDIMATQDNESQIISTARSKIRMDAKIAKKELEDSGETVKTTADDFRDLSYVLTEDASTAHENTRVVGNHLKFIYFAIKDQVQLLEKAVQRFHQLGERQ